MASFGHVGLGTRPFHPFSPVLTTNIVFSAFVILTVSVKVCSSGADDISSRKDPAYFDQFYAQGVKAYTDQLWYKCAHNLEKAVEDYKTFKKTLTDCRMRCKQKEQEAEELSDLPSDLGDLSIFQSFLKRAHCFRKCKSDAYVRRPGLRLTKIVETTFEKQKPYQYLQYCWYKLDRLKLAASASYTYYLKNPEDHDVMRNIAFYRDKAKVPESDFIDLDLVPYKEHYIRALVAYRDDDWPSVTDHLEKGIKEFLVEEERCRVDCEDRIDDLESSSASHFSGAVADHFIKVLECQLGCEGNLSVVYTEPEENFFANQFHYLQYAYYKTDQVDKAVEATASYLLFDPEDEVMNGNKNIFIKKYQYTEDQFVPTEDAKRYAEQRKKLQVLYDFLQGNFMKEVDDMIFVTEADTQSEPLSREAPEEPTTDYQTWMEQYERLGLHLIAQAEDLHRPFRFAADGLLKQEQCDEILALMEDVPVDKKGAQIFTLGHGRETAPSKDENYEASLRLFMRATEVMRHYTQRYYNMSGTLFFKNTIMVCWQQIPEPVVEKDCVPQEFGTCEPEGSIKQSELVKDEFVTVTYLSSMEDGDVYFLGENVSIDTSLGVRHGRTVGFQSGDRHGLHIPVEYRRCALVNTYTTYRSDEERDYTETVEVLQRLEEIRMEKGLRGRKEVMQKLEEMGVRITKNSTALHGGERFAADGLASDAECASLKNMVMSGALVGDGYDRLEAKPSFISPHTEHELFQGLTIYRASKLMHSGVVNTFAMKSFLDLSEKSRLLVEKYFNLTRPLYFDFTHLVCRTPIDENKERKDLSHPVHADNCILQPDGSCLKEYPAYVQRDYSALLYLNDDFRGGEFFFAYPNKSEQVTLKPKCGRLVGFNAKEYHGVRAVRGGTRCALAMWYTMNPNFKELAHVHARKVLQAIQASREGRQKEIDTPPLDTSTDTAAGEREENQRPALDTSTDNTSLREGGQEENQTPAMDTSTDKQDEHQTPVVDTSQDKAASATSSEADAAASKKSDREKNDDDVKAHAVVNKKGDREDGDDDDDDGVKDKVEL